MSSSSIKRTASFIISVRAQAWSDLRPRPRHQHMFNLADENWADAPNIMKEWMAKTFVVKLEV